MARESKSVNDVSPEQINQWIMQHQNNENTDAQDQLVRHYRKLIESLAYKYSKGQSHHEDLVQVGMVGLIGAINRFDLSFDRKFEAFLVPTVIGEIKRYLRDKTWSVHVPRRIKEIGPRIKKVTDELTNELERSPSITEIADRLEVNEEDVLEAMEMGQSYNALSVDHSIEADKDGSTVTLLDIMGQQDDNYDLTEKRMILEKILPILSERERQIIQCTFIEGLSQKETGERIGLSQMHVSRLQRTAIKKLQEAANKYIEYIDKADFEFYGICFLIVLMILRESCDTDMLKCIY
ncbi:RNA polymerase sigma-B factor [Staphylococcus saprophyticus]